MPRCGGGSGGQALPESSSNRGLGLQAAVDRSMTVPPCPAHTCTPCSPAPQDCWDFEVECSYGWVECAGLADRSAYDLTVRGWWEGRAAGRGCMHLLAPCPQPTPQACHCHLQMLPWGVQMHACISLPPALLYPPAAPQAHAGMSKVELNAYERFPEPREEDVLTIREWQWFGAEVCSCADGDHLLAFALPPAPHATA